MVEQVDRDAAADFLKSRMDHKCSAGLDCLYSDQISRGGADWHVLVRAFAAHRIAAEARGMEKAAKIVDEYMNDQNSRAYDRRQDGRDDSFHAASTSAASRIATAIRAALNGGHHE